MKPFTCIDLFCGCGGFSLGLERARFTILAAIDSNEEALNIFRKILSASSLESIAARIVNRARSRPRLKPPQPQNRSMQVNGFIWNYLGVQKHLTRKTGRDRMFFGRTWNADFSRSA